MKTLHLVRSPLLKRKKRFGIFKSRQKKIGEIAFNLSSVSDDIKPSEVIIISTSFARHKKTVSLILKKLLLKGNPFILTDSNLQDKDMKDTLDFLSKTDNQHKQLILIVSKETRMKLLDHFISQKTDIPAGTNRIIELDIKQWTELSQKE